MPRDKLTSISVVSPLLLFSYGPEASDWHIWHRHQGDVFAGDFWDMLEHPERRVPGAWIEGHVRYPDAEFSTRERRTRGMKRKAIRNLAAKVTIAARSGTALSFDRGYLMKLKAILKAYSGYRENCPDDYAFWGPNYAVRHRFKILTYLLEMRPGILLDVERGFDQYLYRLQYEWQSVLEECSLPLSESEEDSVAERQG